jgi:RNA polymerase sigma factor (sigma-70 family)
METKTGRVLPAFRLNIQWTHEFPVSRAMSSGQLQDVLRYLRRTASPPGSRPIADAELLERFVAEHDQAAFEALLWRHGKMVLRTCRRILHDPAEAEDAFQATFLALARRAGSISKQASVAGWLYRVAYRIALAAREDLLARRAREQALVEAPAAKAIDPAAAAAWQEIRRIIDDEVNRLLEIYRLPLILCYFEGKSNAEAARELGCAVGTIESRLTRARERLRVRLSRRGLGFSAGTLALALAQEGASSAAPSALLDFTSRAAVAFTAGQAAAGFSPKVTALTEGVLRTMFLTKLKIASLFLAVGIGTALIGAFWHPARAVSPSDGQQPPASQTTPAPQKQAAAAEQSVVTGLVQQVDAAQRTIALQNNSWPFVDNNLVFANNTWSDGNAQWQYFALPSMDPRQGLTIQSVDPVRRTIAVNATNTWATPATQWQTFVLPQDGTATWAVQPNPWQTFTLPNQVYASVDYPQGPLVIPNAYYGKGSPLVGYCGNGSAPVVGYAWPSVLRDANGVVWQTGGQEIKHKLTPRAKVIIDGKEARLIDLKPNTPVQLTLDKQGLVTRIEATGNMLQPCFVRSFEFAKHLIAIKHEGKDSQYELARDAQVEIDGRESGLSELKSDMALTLHFSAVRPREVIALKTRGPDITVVLKAVNINARTITLRLAKEHLTAADVPVAEDAGIQVNGKQATLADLTPGMQLVLHMAADPEKNLIMGVRARNAK